jgi:hypothetical protein
MVELEQEQDSFLTPLLDWWWFQKQWMAKNSRFKTKTKEEKEAAWSEARAKYVSSRDKLSGKELELWNEVDMAFINHATDDDEDEETEE